MLLVGSGGREHALVWKLLQSPSLGSLYVAPGNGGTVPYNVPIDSSNIRSLTNFASENDCFTIVGPEAPLEKGLIDSLTKNGLAVFGPNKNQARLETSKIFAKQLMKSEGIETAEFEVFREENRALDYARSKKGKVVVKADGLAKGKGVFVCSSVTEAENAITSILVERIFGESGSNIVLEEKIDGQETSFIALCDGAKAIPFGIAVDHKRLLNDDQGPNTGGMGSYSPVPNFDLEMQTRVMQNIIEPVVKAVSFKGFLYAGLMIREDKIYVLEFNARLGDPESQCIIPRIDSDILPLLKEAAETGISEHAEKNFSVLQDLYSCCVVMCARGYPFQVETGAIISGPNQSSMKNTLVFHSGTKIENEKLVTNGGRVLTVTGLGSSLTEASQSAYGRVDTISWNGENHRTDIGKIRLPDFTVSSCS